MSSREEPVRLSKEITDISGFEEAIGRMKEADAEFITLSTRRNGHGELDMNYYFRKDGQMVVLEVKTRENVIPSLYSTFKKADFIEREINNTFGIKFLGHPNLERIPGREDSAPKDSFFKKSRREEERLKQSHPQSD